MIKGMLKVQSIARPAVGGVVLAAALLAPASALVAQQGPPAPLAGRPVAFPDHERFTLPNGLNVVVVSYGTQPVASVRLYVRGGESMAPAAQAGLAGLTATVLTRGTTTRSAEAISEAIEGLGGSLTAAAGRDFFTVSTTVLSEHLASALDLVGDVVMNATFPEDEVVLARRQTLSALQAQQGQPQAVAQRAFTRLAYGADHPYGVSATPASVERIGREDLIGFRDAVLRPQGGLLVVAGRVERAEVERLVRVWLGAWSGAPTLQVELPPAPAAAPTRIVLVHRPGSVQSVVTVGHPTVRGAEAADPALQVANRILGGGADARLFRILREEKGWTYGAYSSVSQSIGDGLFVASAEVRNAVADSAVVELLRQVERMGSEPVPDEELEGARNYLAGSFPLTLETAGQVATQLADALLLGQPVENLRTRPTRIRNVTADQVQATARARMRAQEAIVLVVSDAAEVLAPLQALGPVTVVDVDGNPIDVAALLAPVVAPSWDGLRLREGSRNYSLMVQGNALGTATYQLARDGDDWVSTSSLNSAVAGTQEGEIRFRATDLAPVSMRQSQSAGAMQMSSALTVAGGRVTGTASFPAAMGGDRTIDEDAEGLLLPGMDQFALAVSDLSEGAVIRIPYLDVSQARRTVLEAKVIGRQTIEVPAGSFDTWKVEVMAGAQPLVLYLSADSPHMLVRQDFAGQPVSLELSGIEP